MDIEVNGKPHVIDGHASCAALIERLGADRSQVAVEVNGSIVPRSQLDAQKLSPGDKVEIVRFIGGG